MKYEVVLWDFDGTLVDTSPGIFQSLRTAFDRLGVAQPSQELLNRFIGPPLMHSFQNFLGMSTEEAQRAVKAYREDYTAVGLYNSRIYDGLEPLIRKLRAQGILCGVATLKPQPMAEELLHHFGIAELFDACAGNSLDESGTTTKAQVIRRALMELGHPEPDAAVMIGDTFYDYEGAREAGVAFIGAAYGFGLSSGDDVSRMPGCALAQNAQELERLLL